MGLALTCCRMGLGPIFAVLAAPAWADLPQACAEPSFAAAIAGLEAEGWAPQARGADLSETDTDAIAWTLMARYIGGDTGGQDLGTLLDLQRQAAPGLLRRVDTETTRGRVLLKDGAALTVTEARTAPGMVERVCRLAGDTPTPTGVTPLDTAGLVGAPATLAEITAILPETE